MALTAALAMDFVLLAESEAASRTVRRAPVRRDCTTSSIFASGNGSRSNPFVIRTAAQLSAFANAVNNGESYSGRYIRLGASIDLRNVQWTPIGVYREEGGSRSFSGNFNGAGFSILHMGAGNAAARPATSFFGSLNGATVERVCLQFVNVTGISHVGGLASFMAGSTVNNSRVSGTVSGRNAVGGIVGSAHSGSVNNSLFSGEVTGTNGVGGLVGAVDRLNIRSSSVTGRVDGNTDVGGFVGGILFGSMIVDSTADTVVVNGERNVGGFIGNIIYTGRIERSVFNGQVRGNSVVGGLVGNMGRGFLINSNVVGSVRGRSQAGGIVGEFLDGEVRGCVTSASVDGMVDIGGIAGRMSGGIARDNVNSGMINGGESVGGLVGSYLAAEPMDFALANSTSTGHVRGHFSTGPVVGGTGQSQF